MKNDVGGAILGGAISNKNLHLLLLLLLLVLLRNHSINFSVFLYLILFFKHQLTSA
jgi:hypothetical protein